MTYLTNAEPMTAEIDRLAQIEARLDAATPGPWEDDKHPSKGFGAAVWHTKESGLDAILAGTMRHEDATLIAHAPADLRWLIDRLHDAEQIARLAEESEAGWRRDADEAHAALARVKALADEWDQTYVYNSQLEQLRAVIRGNS